MSTGEPDNCICGRTVSGPADCPEHSNLKNFAEPVNPDQYYILTGSETREGRYGQAKYKIWYEGSQQFKKELSFTLIGD